MKLKPSIFTGHTTRLCSTQSAHSYLCELYILFTLVCSLDIVYPIIVLEKMIAQLIKDSIHPILNPSNSITHVFKRASPQMYDGYFTNQYQTWPSYGFLRRSSLTMFKVRIKSKNLQLFRFSFLSGLCPHSLRYASQLPLS